MKVKAQRISGQQRLLQDIHPKGKFFINDFPGNGLVPDEFTMRHTCSGGYKNGINGRVRLIYQPIVTIELC